MIITFDVSDEINPLIKRALEHSESYMRKVTKSVGYMYQDASKKGAESGSPNGETYQERIPYKIRKALDSKAPTSWYGKLRNAIGYEYLGKGSVAIGWTSATASKYGELQEHGYRRKITSAVRRKWANAGYPLPANKSELVIPARPIFEPMARKLKSEIVPYVEKQVSAYISENVEFGKKKNERRVYKVYAR